ncbi:PREDICTED: probable E3 ubiquitin-protein ligase LUL3 [Camelina sativa]|uniref:RING-type E3 ubiquitin transferase n=1 Tax=Camelina sativa TaxID=90675 RepID=A0ABM0XYS6_CAMSA|nr:PREDICTED: probable E3 ubiquitin-protein ligase LUL3 [Camelina sativa]
MGISFSNRRRDNNHHRHNHNHSPPPLLPSRPPYYNNPTDPPSQQPPPQNDYSYTHNNNLVSTPQLALPAPPPPQPPSSQPPPPPQINHGPYGQNYYQNQYYPQQGPPYFTGYHHNGWNTMMRPVYFGPPTVQVPLPSVEHQNAKKVKNAVNVNKATVKLEPDDLNPGHHLVSFVFDAVFDGSFTVIFFAKEESKCTMVPHLPEAYPPTKVPFLKGTAQKFLQPSGTGTDLGFFSLDDLSKPTTEEVYPLVISAETVTPPNKQITLACLEKTNDSSFKVKVMKQLLWVEGERYELHQLYGIENSTTQGTAASGLEDTGGKECVICLTEPKDTAVMPCRHLCLCSDCAKELPFQSNKCPICRKPIERLVKMKVESSDEQH